MSAKRKPTLTAAEREAEYEAGYNAFMRRTATYALAHAGDETADHWREHARVGLDDKPETEAYIDGWRDAQSRIVREARGIGYGMQNPRAFHVQQLKHALAAGFKTVKAWYDAREADFTAKRLAESRAAGFGDDVKAFTLHQIAQANAKEKADHDKIVRLFPVPKV